MKRRDTCVKNLLQQDIGKNCLIVLVSPGSLHSSKSLDQTSGKSGNFRYIYCIPKSFFVNYPQNWLG